MPSRKLALERLKNRADFVRVTQARNSAGNPGLVLQARPWQKGGPVAADDEFVVRIGFTASRKVGNSVVRNRAKRRLRALSEEVLARHAVPRQDYVLIARQTTATRPFSALRGDLERALKRLNLWRNDESR